MDLILFALWFFLPAGWANLSPMFVHKVPLLRDLKTPMDFGKTFRGKPIFGANKSWRGLIFGVIVATLTLMAQKYLFNHTGWAQTLSQDVNYAVINVWILGPLFGLGALLGDAIESFFKRQRGIPAGQSWFPFDQIDYIVGGLLLSSLVVQLAAIEYVVILALWFLLHMLTTYIGFLVGMKDAKI